MDDCPETVLKKLCCTCLSRGRKLVQLCRVKDGVNNLYLLLSSDPDAYREGFYKDMASLFICWECEAIMRKTSSYRRQVCVAQKHLTAIVDGKTDINLNTHCLSRLSTQHCTNYEIIISKTNDTLAENADNFIDCGLAIDIKVERDVDDIPLAELQNVCPDDDFDTYDDDTPFTSGDTHVSESRRKVTMREQNKKFKTKDGIRKKLLLKNNKYFTTKQVNEHEFIGYREKLKLEDCYVNATAKCESCVKGFKDCIELEKHNARFHTKKKGHTLCDLCQTYVPNSSLKSHRASHCHKHICQLCEYVTYSRTNVLAHLKSGHAMKRVKTVKQTALRSTSQEVTSGSKKQQRNTGSKITPFGYKCSDCDKYFDKKNLRYKHIRRYHTEGYSCAVCGKRYAFKDNLIKHERLHQGPLPREECQTCHKMIRVDLVKTHARIHTKRETFSCVACDKNYISRASYENHLKYSQAHAVCDVLKYKCSMCDKGYRSKGELRDHINYQHLGKTQHQCPICGKALATRRCITRHVRRAHHHLKESARDKICQQCGKAFRDKKGLREHEFIHTGERPLACEICGCTFRQNASLYTHRKRVHKIYPQKKNIELVKTG